MVVRMVLRVPSDQKLLIRYGSLASCLPQLLVSVKNPYSGQFSFQLCGSWINPLFCVDFGMFFADLKSTFKWMSNVDPSIHIKKLSAPHRLSLMQKIWHLFVINIWFGSALIVGFNTLPYLAWAIILHCTLIPVFLNVPANFLHPYSWFEGRINVLSETNYFFSQIYAIAGSRFEFGMSGTFPGRWWSLTTPPSLYRKLS